VIVKGNAMLVTVIALIVLPPFNTHALAKSIMGDWVAIATNGVSAKGFLRLMPNHRYKMTTILVMDAKFRKVNEKSEAFGKWYIDVVNLAPAGQAPRYYETLLLADDREPATPEKLFFYRNVPVLSNIVTTTYARVGDEARAYRTFTNEEYQAPWK
jgi:hypothetical protein